MLINVSGLSDIGQDRNENQDCIDYYVAQEYEFAYLLVADGMGGYTGGAVASQLAAEVIGGALKQLPFEAALRQGQDETQLRAALSRILERANQRILDEKLVQTQLAQMGTTIVVIVIWGRRAVVAHIGDSRAYLWQNHGLQQLTRDHSLVQELVDSGAMTPEEAAHSRQRNVLTRALGIAPEIAPDFLTVPLDRDALFLICSDGLSGLVTDQSIANELARHLPILESCYRLVHMANAAGGKDNISVVLAETAQSAC